MSPTRPGRLAGPLLAALAGLLLVVAPATAADKGPAAPIVVLPPMTEGVALFPEEREELMAAVHAFLKTRRLGPVAPLSSSRRLARLVAYARVTDGGPVCGARPEVERLLDALPGEHAQAVVTATFDCPPGSSKPSASGRPRSAPLGPPLGGPDTCTRHFRLDVLVLSPVVDGRRTVLADFMAVVAEPGRPEAWVAAASALRPLPDRGSLASLMGAGSRVPAAEQVFISEVTLAGDWGALRRPNPARPPSGLGLALGGEDGAELLRLLEARRDALEACHVGSLGAELELDVGVPASGRVWRCDARFVDGLTGPAALGDCLCAAVRKIVFPKGASKRRAVIAIANLGETRREQEERGLYAYAATEIASDRTLAARPRLDAIAPALARCFAGVDGRPTAAVTLRISPGGGVTDVALEEVADLGPTTRACLEAALRRAAFPCTLDGRPATLETRLGVGRLPTGGGLGLP